MRQLSFRKKNQLMALGTGLAILIMLGTTVRSTLSLASQNAQLQKNIGLAQQAPEQAAYLKARSSQLGETLAIHNGGGSLRKKLFEKAGDYCQQYHVQLESFQEPTTFEENDLLVETYELSLVGSFQNQLLVCKALERGLKLGRINSLEFHTVYDRQTKKKYLLGRLYVQTVKHRSNV